MVDSDMWIVGQYRATVAEGVVWDFQGVFFSRDGAVNACRNGNYFIAPCVANLAVPDDLQEWPGVEYPRG